MIEHKKKTPSFYKWALQLDNEFGKFVKNDKCFPRTTYKKSIIKIHLDRHKMLDDFRKFHSKYEIYVQKFNERRKFNENNRSPSPKLRHLVFQKDDFRCVECGATNKQSKLEIDHIKPWSKGGKTILENLQILCFICNRSKYVCEWIGGKHD